MQVYQVRQAALRLLMQNYLLRLYLNLRLSRSPADSFSSFKTPVETSTSPYIIDVYLKNTSVPKPVLNILDLKLTLRFSLKITFGNILSFIVQLFATGNSHFHLNLTIFQVNLQRHQRKSLFRLLACKL